jgi:hypothetical protein
MPGWAWIAIAVAVVVVVAVAAATTTRRRRQRRTQDLRARFGGEYERALESSGGRRKGEEELERRLDRRSELEIAPVRSSERDAYEAEWREIETQFDEAPLPALTRADALAATVLADRGYPMQTAFDRRAGVLSVDHPEAVEHYRRAHATLRRADEGGLSREDLYESLQHYRALLDDVVGDGHPQHPPRDEAAAPPGFGSGRARRDSR